MMLRLVLLVSMAAAVALAGGSSSAESAGSSSSAASSVSGGSKGCKSAVCVDVEDTFSGFLTGRVVCRKAPCSSVAVSDQDCSTQLSSGDVCGLEFLYQNGQSLSVDRGCRCPQGQSCQVSGTLVSGPFKHCKAESVGVSTCQDIPTTPTTPTTPVTPTTPTVVPPNI